ncbi:MAG: transcription antitermination factor NusB [Flavobacteriaceae bacterium]|nr:transcription antitermination factor NusB [Flavobacteriaceae bacterium]
MLTRRHIRIKVLQSVYAFRQSEHQDIEKQEKFLLYSIEQMHELYILLLQLFPALQEQAETYLTKSQKKHLATAEEKNPSRRFIDNKLLQLIRDHQGLKTVVENKKLNYWDQDDEYITSIFKKLRKQDWYAAYLSKGETTFKEDKNFIVKLFKEVIAPSEGLYDYIEDKRLTWVDDFPLVNTALVKVLSSVSENNIESTLIPDLYKDMEDKEYALQLLRKVILKDAHLSEEIEGKTPNWDKDRIAELDMIIIKMGIAEFLYFPSIPVRATINEYLEVAKEYSTPKSSIFINGILDKLVKEYTEADKLKKIGRGLR